MYNGGKSEIERIDSIELTYAQVNGYNIPNLTLPTQPDDKLNRWGRARLNYLRKHKPLIHAHMMTQCLLWPRLLEMQETATEQLDLLTVQMMQAQGVTEELKARDQMRWVGMMNNVRHSAEETVLRELVYS